MRNFVNKTQISWFTRKQTMALLNNNNQNVHEWNVRLYNRMYPHPPVSELSGKRCAAERRDLAWVLAAELGTDGQHLSHSEPEPWITAQNSRHLKTHRRHWAGSWRSPCWRWHAPTPPSHVWLPSGWLEQCVHTPGKTQTIECIKYKMEVIVLYWIFHGATYLFLEVCQFASAENNPHHVLFEVCIWWHLWVIWSKVYKVPNYFSQVMHLLLQIVQLTLSSPSGEESRAFSSCSGVGSASPQISFPKTYMSNTP